MKNHEVYVYSTLFRKLVILTVSIMNWQVETVDFT